MSLSKYPLKKIVLKTLNFFIFLGLGLCLLYFAFKGVSFSQLIAELKHVKYSWVVLSLVFAFGGYASRAYRWKLLIEPLNYNPNIKNVFYSLLIGFFANFAFPRVGEVVRCGSLSKAENIPMESLVGTVIIERTIDFFSLMIILFAIFIAKIDFFGNFLNQYVFIPFYEKLISIFSSVGYLLFGIIIFFTIVFVTYHFSKEKIAHLNFIIKTKKILQGVKEGVKTVAKMRNIKVFIFHTVFIWIMYFLMTWVVVFSLKATSGLGPIDGLFLLVIGGIGMTMPVQGGIGAFHWLTSLALLSLYNIPKTKGLVFATICHESQTILVVVLGSISIIMLFIFNKKKKII